MSTTYHTHKQRSLLTQKASKHVAILAGAGTGKTTRIIREINSLIESRRAAPEEILAVTFSRRSASDLRRGLKEKLAGSATDITVSTFHALAAGIVRTHVKHIGYTATFTILHTNDVKLILTRIIREEGQSGTIGITETAFEAIERLKCKGTLPKHAPQATSSDKAIAQCYTQLQAELLASNCMTFSDLIVYALQILREQPQVLREYSDRFRFIFIDEFQDTNISQYKLLKRLAGQQSKIFAVGDDDQSIFSWRYVPPGMVNRFTKDFGIKKPKSLTRNHRSTATIVQAANGLISHNKGREDKKELTPTRAPGDLIRVMRLVKQEEEAKWIAAKITHLQADTENKDKTIAILCRLRESFPKIEKQLKDAGIDHHVFSRESLYDSDVCKLLLNYLRAVANSKNTIAIARIINTPKRGIGKKTVNNIEKYAKKNKISFWEAAQKLKRLHKLPSKAAAFVSQFTKWQAYAKTRSARGVAKRIIKMTEFEAYMKGNHRQKRALEKMLSMMKPNQSIEDFLDDMMDEKDNGEEMDKATVNLMTMHASKGLQFDYVFLPAWEDLRFPHFYNLTEAKLQEERRLAYVAITRAKESVFMSSILENRDGIKRKLSNIKPSRFIEELPEDFIEKKRSKAASTWLHNHKQYIMPTFDIDVDDIVSHNPYYDDKRNERINYGVMKVVGVLGSKIEVECNNGEIHMLKKTAVTKAILPRNRRRGKS